MAKTIATVHMFMIVQFWFRVDFTLPSSPLQRKNRSYCTGTITMFVCVLNEMNWLVLLWIWMFYLTIASCLCSFLIQYWWRPQIISDSRIYPMWKKIIFLFWNDFSIFAVYKVQTKLQLSFIWYPTRLSNKCYRCPTWL